jgi:two-component system KDP operon response regulator KdpE
MRDPTILVVDDEPQIRRVLRATLASHGYVILEASNGNDAVQAVMLEHPDLVLLDMNMPDMDGLETCGKLRATFSGPIIMATVRDSERDKIAAFDCGADDYVVKPFAMGELLARIRAALRRCPAGVPLKVATRDLVIDFERRLVEVRGERVHLTPKEFAVLETLVANEGKPVPHKRLLQTVWGPDHWEETEYLRAVVNQLRKKLEKNPSQPTYILTEQWLGYRFQLPESAAEQRARRKT